MRHLFILSVLLIFIHANTVVAAKSTPVTVKPIKSIAIYPNYDIPATAISLNESTISAEIKGRIIDLPLKVGDLVHYGQLMARFDCTDYELTVKRNKSEILAIKSDIELIKWQLTRTKQLATKNNASEELVKKYEATLKKLNASLEMQQVTLESSKNQVSKCELPAPFEGVVSKRFANIGEYANVSSPIIHIIDTKHLEVQALLRKNELEQVIQTSNLSFIANDYKYPIKIRAIVPAKDPKSRTQIIRFSFKNKYPLPGTPGRMVWQTRFPAIPAEYVRQVGMTLGIFVADGNKAKFIPLPKAIEGQPAILGKNTTLLPLIINGRFSVEDGDLISIENAK